MSLIPLLYRDWWDDVDRPSRLLDQNFGLGLRREELLNSISSLRSGLGGLGGYNLRPWRELLRQSSGSSTVQVDNNHFQVILDVPQFSPQEIVVKTSDRTVIVEGKHNERQDEHGYISRHFVRKYLLPEHVEPTQVTSTLSSDGLLTITAPIKAPPLAAGERIVPITSTGPARPIITEPPASPAPPSTSEQAHQIPVTPASPSNSEQVRQIPVTQQ